MSEVEPIVEQLRQIVERLDDLSFAELQRALADSRTERPTIDRQVTKARRAIERAIGALEQSSEASDPDEI